jgi:hypothetical protein
MLFDIVVAALIILCGVAVYFALLGIIVLYNKLSSDKTIKYQPDANILQEEPSEAKPGRFEGFKEKIPLSGIMHSLKGIQIGNMVKPIKNIRLFPSADRPKETTEIKDPLLLEHKKLEEEFRRKMEERNEALLQELKKRREESRLTQEEQGATAEPQNDSASADGI